jgi:hypothetical protein
MDRYPTAPLPPVFRAVAETVSPRAAGFSPGEWRAGESIVQTALAARPASVQRQFRLFFGVLNLLPMALHLRTFTRLDGARRLAFLKRLERSPLLLLRRGVWGARTLAFMAVYAQPQVQRAVGYRADPRGWSARAEPAAGTARPGRNRAGGPAQGHP